MNKEYDRGWSKGYDSGRESGERAFNAKSFDTGYDAAKDEYNERVANYKERLDGALDTVNYLERDLVESQTTSATRANVVAELKDKRDELVQKYDDLTHENDYNADHLKMARDVIRKQNDDFQGAFKERDQAVKERDELHDKLKIECDAWRDMNERQRVANAGRYDAGVNDGYDAGKADAEKTVIFVYDADRDADNYKRGYAEGAKAEQGHADRARDILRETLRRANQEIKRLNGNWTLGYNACKQDRDNLRDEIVDLHRRIRELANERDRSYRLGYDNAVKKNNDQIGSLLDKLSVSEKANAVLHNKKDILDSVCNERYNKIDSLKTDNENLRRRGNYEFGRGHVAGYKLGRTVGYRRGKAGGDEH